MTDPIEREAAIAIYEESGCHERGCAYVNQGGGDCDCGYESGLAKLRALPAARVGGGDIEAARVNLETVLFDYTTLRKGAADAIASAIDALIAASAPVVPHDCRTINYDRSRRVIGHPYKPPLGLCDVCGVARALHDPPSKEREPATVALKSEYDMAKAIAAEFRRTTEVPDCLADAVGRCAAKAVIALHKGE